MDLVKFREQTVVIAEHQPEYRPMPAYRWPNDPEGRIACCWRLSWRERLRVLLTGLVWQQVLTFNGPLQPQLLTAEKPDFAAISDAALLMGLRQRALAGGRSRGI